MGSNDLSGSERVRPRSSEARRHLLLTVLGKNPQSTIYALYGRQSDARLAPVALFDLLPDSQRPDRVVALCTPEAKRESWPLLDEALRDRCEVESVDITAADTPPGVDDYLRRIVAALSGSKTGGSGLTLSVDVTHGLRHGAFLTYVGVLYLAALRGVRVRGAYYGLLRRDGPSPFLDLRPLLALPRWTHALEVLRDTGGTLPLADALRLGADNQEAQHMRRDLSRISDSYLSGLPLELGRQAGLFRRDRLKSFEKLLKHDHHLPLADEVVGQLDSLFEPLAMEPPPSGDGWKQRALLSPPELERQAQFIDDLLEHHNTAAALGLMSEWTVSWAVLRLGLQDQWLVYHGARRRAANRLGAIAAVSGDPDLRDVLTGEQCELGGFWAELGELRNAYHHHGMRPQVVVGDRQVEGTMRHVRGYWGDTLRSCPDISLSLGESRGGAVLVSPIGKRPGVLFSALRTCQAELEGDGPASWCLVICSQDTEGFIPEAAQHAGYRGRIKPLRLHDPHGGLSEIEPLVKAARRCFLGAEHVLVNVTGGTTLIGLAAEKFANAARGLACPVRRFGLIDRRPPAAQDADPYQVGEPFWLDDLEEGDGLGP